MTLPDERYRAVLLAKKFLESLAFDKKNYPRIPRKIRYEAQGILRHFPGEWDMENAARAAPNVFEKQMHPLARMFMVYNSEKKEEQNGKIDNRNADE